MIDHIILLTLLLITQISKILTLGDKSECKF